MTVSARAASTRRQLLLAARDAFSEQGWHGTTIAGIVARAQTSRGTFYLYFRNKEHVFAEVMAENCEDLLRATRGSYPQADRRAAVEAATRDYLAAFAKRRGIWRAMLEAFGGANEVEQQWVDLRERFVQRIALNLERGQEAGTVSPGIDTLATAEALAAMIEWLACLDFVVRDLPDHGERFERTVATLTSIWHLATSRQVA